MKHSKRRCNGRLCRLELESLEARQLLDAQGLDGGELQKLTIGTGHPALLTCTDENGTLVTLSMKNGVADIYLSGNLQANAFGKKITVTGSAALQTIDLVETTDKSSLTIATQGGQDGQTDIGEILGYGPMGKLTGKTANLTGTGIDFGQGYILSVALNGMADGTDIVMGGAEVDKGLSIQLGQVGSGCDLTSEAGLSTLKAISWDDGAIQTPWIKSLATTGNKKENIVGDFGADLSVGDNLVDVALTKLAVNGVCSGSIRIEGDAKSIAMDNLTGELIVTGDAKSIKLKNKVSLMAPALPEEGEPITSGRIQVSGVTTVSGIDTKIRLFNGELFTTSEGGYDLISLLGLDIAGGDWTYQLHPKGDWLDTEYLISATATITADQLPDNRYRQQEKISADYLHWSEDETFELIWQKDNDGIKLTGANAELDWVFWLVFEEIAGNLSADVTYSSNDLVVCPTTIGMKEKYSDTGHLQAHIEAVVDGNELTSDMSGTIQTDLALMAHETITIDNQTYNTIKFQFAYEVETTGTIDLSDYPELGSFQWNYAQTSNFTYWATQEVGIVKIIETSRAKVSASGLGSETSSGTIIKTLI